MQKKFNLYVLIFIFSFAIFSCSHPDDSDSEQEKNSVSPNNSKTSVTLINNSSFDVNVFVNVHRKLGGAVQAKIKAGQRTECDFYLSQDDSGDVFYFEYLILIGDISFPYFSYDNSKVFIVNSENSVQQLVIDELNSCPTKSSYLLLENESSSSFYLLNSSSDVFPEGQEKREIDVGKSGVYLLGQNNEPISYKAAMLKVQMGTKTIPLENINFNLGEIYTVVVTNDGASLKSISPFDIDTRRQIWSSKDISPDESPYYSVNCVRSAYDAKDGSFYAGSVSDKTNVIFIEAFDVYGKVKMKNQFIIDKTN